MIQNLHQVIGLIESSWGNAHVLVVGDIMLDRYIWGDVERISPEAPVPVVRVAHNSEQPGGAANVAMNVTGLGAQATLLGFCGEDADRETLEHSLRAAGIRADMTSVTNHPTTSKLRIICGNQQMLRVDMERTKGYPAEAYAELIQKIEQTIGSVNAVILSDYAKGVLSEDVCQSAIRLARQHGIPVLVDPKQREFTRYRGATTICPNLAELSTASGVPSSELDALLVAGQKMSAELGLDCLTATLSERGIALLKEGSRVIAPAVARRVFDVSGAGDTVIATLALALACGLEMRTAAELANVTAGIVVGKVGTVPVMRNELLTSLSPEIELHAEEKVLRLESLTARAFAWRAAGERIVFTNGCFDLLHIGHITLIEDARREGDRLVIGINSDASVEKLKGPSRPIVGEQERARILAALAAVDAVVIFDAPTPLDLILALRPDVIVKGGDYSEETVVGAKNVRSWGGRVKIVPTVDGFSTTRLIARATANSSVELSLDECPPKNPAVQ
jgi:D-beta-D-heptose 7-phosphate kinase/D-beta-D-heptose 1-phosphate adenosyltransferase